MQFIRFFLYQIQLDSFLSEEKFLICLLAIKPDP